MLLPLLKGSVVAIREKFELLLLLGTERSFPSIVSGQSQQLPIPHPEASGDKRVRFFRSSSDALCGAPREPVVTGRIFDFLRRPVFDFRPVAPDAPEPAVMMDKVVVQVESQIVHVDLVRRRSVRTRHDRVDDGVFAAKHRQSLIVNCVRIGRSPLKCQDGYGTVLSERARRRQQQSCQGQRPRTKLRSSNSHVALHSVERKGTLNADSRGNGTS